MREIAIFWPKPAQFSVNLSTGHPRDGIRIVIFCPKPARLLLKVINRTMSSDKQLTELVFLPVISGPFLPITRGEKGHL